MIKKIGRFFKLFLLGLWLTGTTAWAVLAVNFGDSSSGALQFALSIIIALIGLIVLLALLFTPYRRYRILSIHSIVFVAVLFWWFHIQPSNDRNWQTDVSKLAYARIAGDLVTVRNIRNFSYRNEFDYRPDYYDKTFDLNKLEGVDLFAVYWMGPAIAHTIMSFDFGDHNHLAISIEARKEEGEGYSTIKGFFRQFELMYIVADERDVIGLRANYRQDPPEQVYRYRINMPKENVKRFFMEYIMKINRLYERPAFYNTLFANCTSLIWLHSRVIPGHLPFSWKILMSGYVPEYLYESGRLNQQMSFSELREYAHVNPLIKEREISALFSSKIRSQSAKANTNSVEH